MDASVKFDGLRLRLREVREVRLRLRFGVEVRGLLQMFLQVEMMGMNEN